MSTPNDRQDTGRQDEVSPSVTTEKSDPTNVDVQRGERLWLGFALVGLVMVAVLVYFLVTD
jgi:hypothetical protein